MDRKKDLRGPGLVLDRRNLDLFHRGVPELPLEEIPAARGLPPGAAAPILDGRGRRIGAGVADPDRRVLRIWSRGPAEAFDGDFFRRKIEAALERRAHLIRSRETSAYRLLHGDGDGLSGINVDFWDGFLVLELLGRGPALWREALEGALEERLEPRGIIEKLALPESGGPATAGAEGRPLERGKVEERVVSGERPPDPLIVRENGIPFAVRLLGARHAGLFTDMRDERRRLSEIAGRPPGLRRVLNAFAYTGSFSVVAAWAGAEVTTVDIVGKVLEWAKENFRLSGIDPDLHHFARMDVLEHLRLARKRGWLFDAIILDPPTFAAAKGARWSLRRDYPKLIGAALEALAPGGYLWVAANAAGVPSSEVDRWIAAGSARAGRTLRTIARAGQPSDYPAHPGLSRYMYLKVRVLRAADGGD